MSSKSILYCAWAASHSSSSSSPSLPTMTLVFLLVSFLLFLCFFFCSWAIIVRAWSLCCPMIPLCDKCLRVCQSSVGSNFCTLCLSCILVDKGTFNFCRTMSLAQASMTLRCCIQEQMYQANKYCIFDTKNKVTKMKKIVFSKPVFNIPVGKLNIHILLLHRPQHSYSWA